MTCDDLLNPNIYLYKNCVRINFNKIGIYFLYKNNRGSMYGIYESDVHLFELNGLVKTCNHKTHLERNL